mgnify:CR=1 FL=1
MQRRLQQFILLEFTMYKKKQKKKNQNTYLLSFIFVNVYVLKLVLIHGLKSIDFV